jgi:tetratricopeptide (TPR) repeat protein
MYITLFQLGTLAHFRGDLHEADRLYQECLKAFEQQQNAHRIAAVYMQLGNLNMEQGKLLQAAKCYRESLDIYQEIQSYEGLAKVWLNQGILAKAQGNYTEARTLLAKSRKRFERLGVELGKSSVYRELGDLSTIDNSVIDAGIWYQRSLATVTTRMDFVDVSQRMGDLAFSIEDYCKAKRFYLRCLDLADAIDDNATVAHVLARLSFIEKQMKRYARAREYYDRCVDIPLGQHWNRQEVATTISILGQVAYEFKDYTAAEAFFSQSLKICKDLNFREGVTGSLADLADLRVKQGNIAEAERLYVRLIEMEEQLELVEDMVVDMFNLAMAFEQFGHFDESERWLRWVIELESQLGSPDVSRDRQILKRVRLQKTPGVRGWVIRRSVKVSLKAVQMLSQSLDYMYAILTRMECWADHKVNKRKLKVSGVG